ncbi:hypothetical protein CVD28_08260 [Bacillus sp. M6-12]|uniref:DUF1700 domain-containing protein n=1 Tax=Bacillus sp. M6-12 TaxID=2054166 RepID=UPI000C763E91|nr:DUF1700 domain-containing protein [Bacillus sp. M6-12]PLS18267.1 hypothetical protein CVD28_08260 [Bacillus sp. M6-12]
MENMVTRYLNDLRSQLRSLPNEEREDAVNEIASHIAESQSGGKPLASILSDLGDAKTLAKAYLSHYHLQKVTHKKGVGNVILSSFYFATTGFLSVVVIPTFLFISLVFGVFTILMPIFGVMRTFGAKNIFVLWDDVQIPSLLGIPAGILLGLLFAGLTWLIIKMLIAYFRLISKGYQRVVPR